MRQIPMLMSQSEAMPLPGADIEYTQSPSGVDEVFAADGEMRAHWRYLLESLQTLGEAGIDERQQKAQRILRDDGATYKIYADPGSSQTWQLNPIPLLIDREEWSQIEGSLVERAELFNLILEDVYGPRRLIKQRIIPPELVFSHGGFLRPCQGVKLRGDQQLILHGVDLVRGPDGAMKIMADRTQAPSGAGYALENRIVMSRVFPSLFRD